MLKLAPPPRWAQLCAFVAATGKFHSKPKTVQEVTRLASLIYQIPQSENIAQMAGAINNLGKKERKRLCKIYRQAQHLDHPQQHRYKPDTPELRLVHVFPSEAPSDQAIRAFYDSWEWKRLSYDTKIKRGRKCECCGAQPPKVRINTDHVRPIRHYWKLRLDQSNLQILCEDCNMGKGSRDLTDFR